MVVAGLLLWGQVSAVVPEVGQDEQGVDPWLDPIGVEKVGPFQVAHIPDCAAAPVVRIELWDEESNPYWRVVGPPTPMASFAIGAVPEGFLEELAYEAPPPDAVQRLVVVRKVKGVAGVRFRESDLRTAYVATGQPIVRYPLEDFRTGSVCADDDDDGEGGTVDDGDEGTGTEPAAPAEGEG
jgi:hypothetical protein